MKKIISLFLCTALVVCLFPASVFASNIQDTDYLNSDVIKEIDKKVLNKMSTQDKQTMQKDLKNLEKLGFSINDVSEINNKDKVIEYVLKGDFNEKVSIEKNTEDSFIKMLWDDGEKSNEVIIDEKNKEIYLDGSQVNYSNTNTIIESSDAEQITPSATITYNLTNSPYGNASDYTKYSTSMSNFNIELTTTLRNVTIGALAVIIGKIYFWAGVAHYPLC